MMGERGELLFSCRGFRTLGQLILEWVVAIITAISMFLSLFNPLNLLVAAALGYLLYRLMTGWHRKRVEIWGGGLAVGGEFIPWSSVKDFDITGPRVEAGMIIGQTTLSYEEVVDVTIRLADRGLKLRLKKGDLEGFVKAVEEARRRA